MTTRVAIAGLGAVGRVVAERIARDLPEYTISAVSARRTGPAQAFLDARGIDARVMDIGGLAEQADIILECAPATLYRQIAEPVVAAGKILVTLSVGALLDSWDLVEQARATGGRILVPSGAILGLDAVQGVAQGTVHSVQMVTRKPLEGLRGAPYLAGSGFDLDDVLEPVCIFRGSAREAISGFPANLNVAIALSLAGVGPDRTQMEVWADPHVDRNIHRVVIDSDSAHLDLTVQNIPSDNPATGRLTPLSVVALLKKLSSPLQIGT